MLFFFAVRIHILAYLINYVSGPYLAVRTARAFAPKQAEKWTILKYKKLFKNQKQSSERFKYYNDEDQCPT